MCRPPPPQKKEVGSILLRKFEKISNHEWKLLKDSASSVFEI